MSSDSERLRCTWRSISTSGHSVQVPNMILHGYDLDASSRLCESFQQLQRESAGKLGVDGQATKNGAEPDRLTNVRCRKGRRHL